MKLRLGSADWKVIALLVVIAVAFLAKCAKAEQCFPSLEAARAVHPSGHLSWTDRSGPRKFYAGYPRAGVKCDVSTERQVVRNSLQRTHEAVGAKQHESRPRPATSLAGAASRLVTYIPSPFDPIIPQAAELTFEEIWHPAPSLKARLAGMIP